MENATIDKIEPMEAPLYISINYAGFNFQIIYGQYRSGGYCCIPNFGVSTDLSEYSWDTFYNAERLANAFIQMENWERNFAFDVGKNLALVIEEAVEYTERTNKDE